MDVLLFVYLLIVNGFCTLVIWAICTLTEMFMRTRPRVEAIRVDLEHDSVAEMRGKLRLVR